MKFKDLTQIALLGTERQSFPGMNGVTPLDQLGAQLNMNEPERTLLSLAALSSLHERIGALPVRDIAPLPEPCGEEVQSRVNTRAASLLLRLLGGEFAELLPEFLKLSARAGQLAPPEALPSLLE